jgi:hypothetical protein
MPRINWILAISSWTHCLLKSGNLPI